MKLLVLAFFIASAAASGTRCKKADDCEEDECCVNYILVNWFGGHCRKLREEGKPCIPLKDGDKKPDMYHFLCPCKKDLKCEHTRETKIGEHIIGYLPKCIAPESTEERTTTEGVTTTVGGDGNGKEDDKNDNEDGNNDGNSDNDAPDAE